MSGNNNAEFDALWAEFLGHRGEALAAAEPKWLELRGRYVMHRRHGGCQCDWYAFWNRHVTRLMTPPGWYSEFALGLER